ncbi:MAG TPA: hemerythrin domain-containing protein [Solirubrobacterales bacterium]|nr:hemerythrin domain-containing protein [Solirubrobacterales bacterium]
MKRDPALQPLSRDHHQALFVAQRLRRAEEADAAAAEFLAFWREHGRRHFQVEEEVLFPAWAEREAGYDEQMVLRALTDHHAVRLAARRAAASRATLEELRELGVRLDAHVRFEEREMFPEIEAGLDRDELGALAEEIERAEAGEPIS